MRRCLAAILVVGLAMSVPRDAAAQPSEQEAAAYAAFITTPLGALSPIMIAPGTKGDKSFSSFAGRYAHFAPQGGGDGTNTFGASFYHKAGMNAAFSGTAAYLTCSGCDGLFMAGADVHSTLWNSATTARSTSATSINFQGGLGYGTQDGNNALSISAAFPLAVNFMQASKSNFGLYLAPGYMWGRVSGGGVSESGAIPFVGAGASWMAAAGWGIHASYQKGIVADVSGNTFGVGFSWNMGAAR